MGMLKNFNQFGVSYREKIIFTKNLGLMLHSGIAVSETLDILADQSSGRFKRIILAMKDSVSSGNTLSSAMKKYPKIFSLYYSNIISVGETSGTLEENLLALADQMTKHKDLSDKVKGAMIYPAIVFILSIGLGMILSFVVLPKLTPLFLGLKVKLPLSTRLLIWIGEKVQKDGTYILVSIFGSITILIWLLRQKFFHPVSHLFYIGIPLFGNLTINKNLAVFCRSLGTLLKSGISIDEALNITSATLENYYYRKRIDLVRQRVSQGSKIADALAEFSFFFPKITTGMIRVGEKSGTLTEELFNLAEIYESETDVVVKRLSAIVEPALLLIIGVVVGGLAISIIAPIYQITGNISR
jgi:type IV pilus assembly protein PilC